MKILIVLALVLGLLILPIATMAAVTCPNHPGSTCYSTGQPNVDATFTKWHCSCGDDVWVKN
ncbi:MAG: hypothetical protein WB780_08450 [Candidatus Acidiferrales bacterium]